MTNTCYIRVIQGQAETETGLYSIVLFLASLIFIIGLIIAMSYGETRIRLKFTEQTQDAYLSLQTNFFGIMAVSFVSSILLIPGIATLLDWKLYRLLEFAGIIFFTYFWTGIIINPTKIAATLEKYGGSVPDIGNLTTASYIERIWVRVIFIGAIFIGLITTLLPSSLIEGIAILMYIGFGAKKMLKNQSEYAGSKGIFVHSHLDKILAVKGLLESKGIKTTLSWEPYGRIVGFNVGLLGEKRLLVSREDYYKSIGLLNKYEELL